MLPTDKKIVAVTPPAAIVDNAAFGTTVIDTLGFRFCEIYVFLGALDIAVATLKVQESDGLSAGNLDGNAVDVVGTRFGTDANDTGSTSTLPSATDDNKFFKFEIDLRGRKRYLDLSLTGGDGSAGSYACAFALLSRGEISPTTASQKGCSQVMRVPPL